MCYSRAMRKLPRRIIAADLKSVKQWISWAYSVWTPAVAFYQRQGYALPEHRPDIKQQTIRGLRESAKVLTDLADYMESEMDT